MTLLLSHRIYKQYFVFSKWKFKNKIVNCLVKKCTNFVFTFRTNKGIEMHSYMQDAKCICDSHI